MRGPPEPTELGGERGHLAHDHQGGGLDVSCRRHLVEFVEYPAEAHPFLVGTQAHPELKSRPTRPHPLFVAFVGAALDYKNEERLPVEMPEIPELSEHRANGAEHALEDAPARG